MEFLKEFLESDNIKLLQAIFKELQNCKGVEKSYTDELIRQFNNNSKEIYKMGGVK